MTTQPVPVDHPAGSQYRPEKDAYDDPTFSREEFAPPVTLEQLEQVKALGEQLGIEQAEHSRYENKVLGDFQPSDPKLAKPVDPRRRGVLIFALVVASLIFATSALFSFATVATAAAEWMLPAWPWLAWLVPGFVEAFIIYFGVDAIINQANGRKKDAQSALAWMFVFAGVGVVANGAHTASSWLATGEIPWQGFIGIAMSALAPLSVVLITKRVSKLVFLDPNG